MVETPQEESIVRRCQATVILAFTDRCTDDQIAELVADLSRLPAEHPDRTRLAAAMLMALFREDPKAPVESAHHLGELLRMADADPPSGPRWTQVRAFARMLSVMHGGLNGQAVDMASLDGELTALAETVGDNPAVMRSLDALRMMTQFMRAIDEGNESALLRAQGDLAKYLEQAGDHPELASMMSTFDLIARGMTAMRRGDHADGLRYVERFQEVAASRPQGDFLREAAAEAAMRMKALGQMVANSDTVGYLPLMDDDQLAELEAQANRPDATDHDRALHHLALGGAAMGGELTTSLERVEAGVEHYRQALRLTPADRPLHTSCLQSLALGLFRRSEMAGTTDGLDEAVRLLEDARALLGGPHHPQWTQVNGILAAIRHRIGNFDESGEIGLSAQRGYAWRSLLESDAGGAKIAIRDAAQSAVDLARRLLQAGKPVDALRALDTGRGLMLFAATELRRIPTRLAAAGRADLARRWETEGRASDGLRREVLSVLAELPDVAALLDPPSLNGIQSALAALDADALVYLVAAELPQPGMAVIAPVKGSPALMALPNLTVRGDDDVERYLTTLADRSRDLAPQDDSRFTDRLAALCDWAWRAAIGPLLEGYFADRPRTDGRVPRIVLVPMGDLARIPWQAARRGDGVYAVELAAFSQTVSARLLCENAARPPVALSPAGLVVGDPDTGGAARTLAAARFEAHAIRNAFYQGARYVGRRPNGTVSPSGRGTAADVGQWLTDSGPAAGVMLHLACHGSFATGPDGANSCLLLSPAEPGEDGAGELTAEEILDLLAAAGDRRIGLVVLAACNTGRSVHGYDEAFSLGTAFLAGGACSVLSTQWSIPDAQTSSLMYLFHHYCRHERMPPWQALRQAQMWMLDPKRRAPERMPVELLQSIPEGEPAPLAAWAGFVHFGQ